MRASGRALTAGALAGQAHFASSRLLFRSRCLRTITVFRQCPRPGSRARTRERALHRVRTLEADSPGRMRVRH